MTRAKILSRMSICSQKMSRNTESCKLHTILDCPGIVPTDECETTLVLRNTIKPEDVLDVEGAAKEIIARANREQILRLYKIDDFVDHKDFLIKFAEKSGKIKRGGVLDLDEAARVLIRDWNTGRIPYYVAPPTMPSALHNVIVTN